MHAFLYVCMCAYMYALHVSDYTHYSALKYVCACKCVMYVPPVGFAAYSHDWMWICVRFVVP